MLPALGIFMALADRTDLAVLSVAEADRLAQHHCVDRARRAVST